MSTPSPSPVPSGVEAALAEYGSETLYLLDETGTMLARAGNPLGPLGYTADDPEAARHPAEHVHPDDLLSVLDLVARVRATPGGSESVRVRARHRDGSWRTIEATVTHAGDDDRLRGAVLRARDVTDLVGVAVSNAFADFRSLAEVVPSGILSADAHGFVVFANAAAQWLLDLPLEALRGRGWEAVLHAEDLPDVRTASTAVLGRSPGEQVTFRVHVAAGERWLHSRFVPLPGTDGPDGPSAGWIATLDDVTERRQTESTLAHQATHDALTGLPNRHLLDDRLEQACARRRRDGSEVAVLFVDLDGFKAVNDRHGHDVGDRVLCEVARRLCGVLRASDTVARVGGDEFVVVAEGLSGQRTADVAARIEEAVAEPMLIGGARCSLGASVGVAWTGALPSAEADLVLLADRDMYRRKLANSARDTAV